jgi:hypothetical protein
MWRVLRGLPEVSLTSWNTTVATPIPPSGVVDGLHLVKSIGPSGGQGAPLSENAGPVPTRSAPRRRGLRTTLPWATSTPAAKPSDASPPPASRSSMPMARCVSGARCSSYSGNEGARASRSPPPPAPSSCAIPRTRTVLTSPSARRSGPPSRDRDSGHPSPGVYPSLAVVP